MVAAYPYNDHHPAPGFNPNATIDWARLAPKIEAAANNHGLSIREMQVLIGVEAGLNNSQIGGELYLAEDTVKTHLRRLFRKLGARNRTQAVALAWRKGIFSR